MHVEQPSHHTRKTTCKELSPTLMRIISFLFGKLPAMLLYNLRISFLLKNLYVHYKIFYFCPGLSWRATFINETHATARCTLVRNLKSRNK